MSPKCEPIGRKLSAVAKVYIGVLSEKLSGLDIERYYYPLLVIAEKQDSPLSQQQLADHLALDKVSTLRIVNYLTEKGYITREKQESDKRAHFLLLTPKANREIQRIEQAINELNRTALQGFSSEETANFNQMLASISKNLKELPFIKVRVNYKKVNRSKTNEK